MATNNMTPEVSQKIDEIAKAARKRGRAYRCLRCYHREGKNFIEVKCRVEAHILRDHLRRDEVPHYCSLCQFRCLRREELEDHMVKYRRQRVLAEQSGVDPDDTTCLKSNATPYVIDEKDFSVLDRKSSFQHWKETLESRRKVQDPLAKAVNEIFPGGIPDFDFEDEEPLPKTSIKPPQQAIVSLDGSTLKATLTPLLERLSSVVDQQTLKNLLGEPAQEQAGRMEVEGEQLREEGVAELGEKTEKEGQAKTVEKEERPTEENLMNQLLPQEDQILTPKRKRAGTIIPNKAMRTRSPSSGSESTYDSGSESSDDGEETKEEKKELVLELRATREAVQRNTRVLQSLEESILTLASAMTAVAKATKEGETVEEDNQKSVRQKESMAGETKETQVNHRGQTYNKTSDGKDRKERKREHSRERKDERHKCEKKHERYNRDRSDEKYRRRSHSDNRRDRPRRR